MLQPSLCSVTAKTRSLVGHCLKAELPTYFGSILLAGLTITSSIDTTLSNATFRGILMLQSFGLVFPIIVAALTMSPMCV